MGAGEAMAFTESDFQSEGIFLVNSLVEFTPPFLGGVIVPLRSRYELCFISDWISLDVPRWVHTSFCSYYFELSPRDLRFRVLSWGIPGNLKAHARYRSNGSRRYEKVFSDIRSPEVIWDRVNAFIATARVRSENRYLVKRVVIFVSCVIDFGLWFLESG